MATGKLHNCLKQPQKKSYAPTDSNIDWRELERSANKQMMQLALTLFSLFNYKYMNIAFMELIGKIPSK